MLEAVLIVLFSVQLSILSFRLLTLLPASIRETLLKAAGFLFLGSLLTFFLLCERRAGRASEKTRELTP